MQLRLFDIEEKEQELICHKFFVSPIYRKVSDTLLSNAIIVVNKDKPNTKLLLTLGEDKATFTITRKNVKKKGRNQSTKHKYRFDRGYHS